uniref:Ig-like domain-containing protein n=1 Tax=Mustela putorius furo TaxID=9669 RepID=M3YAS6_MUSPF
LGPRCLICLRFLLPVSGVRAPTIHQGPPVSVQPIGSLLALECTVKGTSVPYLYWYLRSPGGTPALLFSSVNVDQIVRETPQNFTALRPTDVTPASISAPGVSHRGGWGRHLYKTPPSPGAPTLGLAGGYLGAWL